VGTAGPDLREVWFVCHGYGQLAQYFLRHFEPLDDGTRLMVAPEALSRFYLGSTTGSHVNARIGATWMTREDRLHEIQDYVAYLDAVHQRVLADLHDTSVRTLALGFSQGVATVCRWAAMGKAALDELVLWAERPPPDLDLARTAERFRRLRLRLIYGVGDPYLQPGDVAEQRARLDQHGIPYEVLTYQGGHELDAPTLRRIAGG
jgi:predicted esterase